MQGIHDIDDLDHILQLPGIFLICRLHHLAQSQAGTIPPMAATESCASLRAVGVDEHALSAQSAIMASVNRFQIDVVLLLFV